MNLKEHQKNTTPDRILLVALEKPVETFRGTETSHMNK